MARLISSVDLYCNDLSCLMAKNSFSICQRVYQFLSTKSGSDISMDKLRYLIIAILISVIGLLCACSIQSDIPTGGEYYCEELRISIDFSAIRSTPECGKVYQENGEYDVCRCMLDYGSGIWICSLDQEITYLIGSYSFEKNTFKISTSDGKVYTFMKKE